MILNAVQKTLELHQIVILFITATFSFLLSLTQSFDLLILFVFASMLFSPPIFEHQLILAYLQLMKSCHPQVSCLLSVSILRAFVSFLITPLIFIRPFTKLRSFALKRLWLTLLASFAFVPLLFAFLIL